VKFLRTFLLSLSLVVQCFAADGWRVFSTPFPIYSAAKYGNGVVYATGGGVRIKTPTFDRVYTANNGLETASLLSVAAGPRGVYAVSEYGMIASLRGDMEGWMVISRSYVANGRKIIADASRLVGDVLVLVFEDRIAFFDVAKEKSILTISRIADISLAVYPPKFISIHGDELYVSIGKRLFKRKMAWDGLWNDVRLIDPDTWTEVKVDGLVNGMAWKGDSLKTFPVEGIWRWDGDVETSSVQDSSLIKLHGVKVEDSFLYENGRSVIKWIFSYDDGTDYLIGPEMIYHFTNGKFDELGVYHPYELGGVYEVAATYDGGVIAASPRSAFAYSAGEKWSELRYYDETGIGNLDDAYGHRMKVLSVMNDGHMLYHIWGEGFYLFSDWGKERIRHFTPKEGLCLDNYGTNFMISSGTTVAPDSAGFLVATADTNGYSLAYISLEAQVSCLGHVGSAAVAGPIVARYAKNGVDWEVYVGTRKIPSAATTGNLDVFVVSPPLQNGGRLVKKSRKTAHGLDGFAPIDLALDSKNEVLWVATPSKVGYMNLDQDTIQTPSSVSGLLGAEYTSLSLDPHGNLWVGTAAQGIFRLSRKGNSYDTLSTLHITSKNGMLSDAVDDLVVNPVKGVLWIAHSRGVSWYKRNDLRENESFMTDSAAAEVVAYPNPFRPKIHRYITFDFLAEDATLSIYNRGGALIRFFSNGDMFGGRVDWDGKDKNGKLVVPGVYYYVVKNSKKTKKGKFIIIH
jgi:hypothetical protein